MKDNEMTREEFCIAQSMIASIRNISSLYESETSDEDITESLRRISEKIIEETGVMQRENAIDFTKWL